MSNDTCPDCEKYREGLRKAACALVDVTTVAKRAEVSLEALLDLLGDPPLSTIEKFLARTESVEGRAEGADEPSVGEIVVVDP